MNSYTRPTFIVAFFDVDRHFGGPEEGGWWYDAGNHLRTSRVFKDEGAADAYCNRANRLLSHLQRHRRPISSVLSEGRVEAFVWTSRVPDFFPAERPRYE